MHIIIDVVKRCNLRCGYCFSSDNMRGGRMTTVQVEEVFREISQTRNRRVHRNLAVGFSGGEPMLMGIPFFEQVVKLRQKYFSNKKVPLVIQTNLTLLDRKWIHFLGTHPDIGLVASCDVIEAGRGSCGGKSIEALLHNNLERLVDAKIPFSANCVISRVNVQRADTIYRFFKSLGVDFSTIPVAYRGDVPAQAELGVTASAYGKFLIQLARLWMLDRKPGIVVGNIAHYLQLIRTGKGIFCHNSGNCAKFTMAVEPNGDVIPCPILYDSRYRHGNIYEQTIDEIMTDPSRRIFYRRHKRIRNQCRDCAFVGLCRGGCPAEAVACGDVMGPSYYCAAYFAIFTYLKRMTESAA